MLLLTSLLVQKTSESALQCYYALMLTLVFNIFHFGSQILVSSSLIGKCIRPVTVSESANTLNPKLVTISRNCRHRTYLRRKLPKLYFIKIPISTSALSTSTVQIFVGIFVTIRPRVWRFHFWKYLLVIQKLHSCSHLIE